MSYRAWLPTTWVGVDEHLRKVTQVVNQILDAVDIKGDITLNAGSVIIENNKIGEDAIVLLQPLDAGAADTNWYAQVTNNQVEFFYVSGTGGNFRYQIIL